MTGKWTIISYRATVILFSHQRLICLKTTSFSFLYHKTNRKWNGLKILGVLVTTAVCGFCGRFDFAPHWPLINLSSFYRINTVCRIIHFHFGPALPLSTKSYAIMSCKHTSLYLASKCLLQQLCCGLQSTWPTVICLLLSGFSISLCSEEIHVRRGWSVILLSLLGFYVCWTELTTWRYRSKLRPVLNELPVVVHLLVEQNNWVCALLSPVIKVSGGRRLQSAIWLVCWSADTVVGITSCCGLPISWGNNRHPGQ